MPSGTPKAKPRVRARPKAKTAKEKTRAPARTEATCSRKSRTNYFPYKCHSCGEKWHNAAKCGEEKGKGRGKKGVYGVDEDDANDVNDETTQVLGDIFLSAVEEAWEASTRQTVADFPGDFPPGLIDPASFDPRSRLLDQQSNFGPCDTQSQRDT